MDRAGPRDFIGYQELMQDAMRQVMAGALRVAARNGALPGDHHFYITFRTHTQGVEMADQLKDRFPEEMTIVIQHQFWDFEVFDDRFELILQFSGVPQHLSIPFVAVTRFVDPSLSFGLQFAGEGDTAQTAAGSAQPAKAAGQGPVQKGGKPAAAARSTPPASGDKTGDGSVVSLDAFRRK